VSAATGTDARQPRITVAKIILKMVFMFFLLVIEWIQLSRQSIAAGRHRKSTECVFSNLPNVGQVLAADWFIDMTVCYAGIHVSGTIPRRTILTGIENEEEKGG
jgi:hypothetical protein